MAKAAGDQGPPVKGNIWRTSRGGLHAAKAVKRCELPVGSKLGKVSKKGLREQGPPSLIPKAKFKAPKRKGSVDKRPKAPLLKGRLTIPDIRDFQELVDAPEGPDSARAFKEPAQAVSSHVEATVVEAQKANAKEKKHFWRDSTNRSLLRVLQRQLGKGAPPASGVPSQEDGTPDMQRETHQAAVDFIRASLIASGGAHRKGTSLEKMERAKPRRTRL
ncbi:hypothetical protein cyc_04472 [Cyclospora cayetanensis]|uniref:Uncharacterized protein n=1 Tax=Cyclospora cayetanensis TaxID=88456 RepID=A0A1D3D0A0_9EIME|nr:hypothetical protein cyc_04472 [Cyclospora cayetanensis]